MTRTEIEINAELILALLGDQHPDLADLPITLGALGWDNQLWKLGENLAVRLPWATPESDELLLKEQTWVPGLASTLPLPIPVPQRLGLPSERFPRPWIVTTWVPGEPADRAPVPRGPAADTLANFLTALHRPAPSDAPMRESGRKGALVDSAQHFTDLLQMASALDLVTDQEAVREVWNDAVAAPAWDGPALWLHADLHPANILTAEGDFCGVIDFGALCAGDPAVDLSAAWLLLADGDMDRFHEAYEPKADDATLRRARGWAVLQALDHIGIGEAGIRGRPGGKATWGPPAHASLRRLLSAGH